MRIIVFAVATALLAWISRHSLAAPASHGFYRFFAWECIVALACLNFVSVSHWFHDPFSARQVASWVLLCLSLVPLVAGTRALRHRGRPSAERRGDVPLLGIERTTQLVTSGIYRWIRHPMYLSLLLVAWGVYLKRLHGAGLALAVATTALLYVTARREEAEDVAYFGDTYRSYMRGTRRFIPLVW